MEEPEGLATLTAVNQELYDEQSMVSGTPYTQLVFFTVPYGGTKTLDQTNLRLAGQIERPWHFHWYGIQLRADHDISITSWGRVFDEAAIVMTIGTRDYIELPCVQIPSGPAIAGLGGGVNYYTNGLQDVRNYKDVTVRRGRNRYPIDIPAGQSFRAEVKFAKSFTPVQDFSLMVTLLGILYQGTQ